MLLFVLFYQFQQALHGEFCRNILFYASFAAIQAHLAATCSHVAVVCIGHLAGSVDDAAHDADFQAGQMRRSRLNSRDGVGQIVQGATTAGARYIFGLGGAQASRL